MGGLLKILIGVACIAITAWVGPSWAGNLNPSAKKVDRCEKDYNFVVNGEAADPLPEIGMKYFAVQFADCEEFGVFSSRQMRNILDSQVGPYFTKYKADTGIWRTAN